MPPYFIPTVLIGVGACVLFALLDEALWEVRHRIAERECKKWREANKPE